MEVFVHDPIYAWACLTPKNVQREAGEAGPSSYTGHLNHQSVIRTCEMKPPGFKPLVQLGDGMLVEALEHGHVSPCILAR